MSDVTITRRGFLSCCLAGMGAVLLPGVAGALGTATRPGKRTLSFFNTHTGETLTCCYWRDGAYIAPALRKIDHLLRDHRTGETQEIDRGLLDLLHRLQAAVGGEGKAFHVISGYRSPKTNARLRAKSRGVAGGSLHLKGQAIDIRLPGTRTSLIRDTALVLKSGGVGYYASSDFVHVDVGRVRRWSG